VGELPPAPGTGDITVYLAEGFATAASLHQALGQPVVVAFHAGNLVAVATALRERYPLARLVVCADDDHLTPGNPGRTMAMAAARAVAGELAVPIFPGERPAWATDFNDLHRLHGLSAVQTALMATETAMDADPDPAAAHPAPQSGDSWSEDSWPLPEPLTSSTEAQPYPTDALPALLREAVLEAQAFVQAPDALVACSALSTLSLAGQGLVNVRRDQRLVGPVSLYLLSVAESGERKTTCDRIFGAALRDWEMERLAASEPELLANDLATATYEAKRAGLLEAIKRKRRDGQSTVDDEQALEALATEVPEPVKVPRLMYADATPEALSHALATGWPSAAVMSAEAGAVFGAHGMGYETILRNLALLNVLWDGGEIAVDRRSKSSFRLRDRRLTFRVMVQPEALRGFIERAGALPRGSGFIARFLIAWPASTQGHRPYRAAPAAMPSVDRFNARIRTLLNTPLRTDAKGGLQPAVLDLSPAAHTVWVQAHDHIERQLCDGGRYAAIRDVAAKAAENIARVAALLHLLDHGPSAEIGPAYVEGGVRIVAWHLDESLRLLADLDAPPEMASAIRFDAWLRSEASRTGDHRIAAARIYQYGPGCVRDQKDLKQALALLEDRGRVRVVTEGRRRFVTVNPALLASSSAAS
jgi:putative DNA primase/helicase